MIQYKFPFLLLVLCGLLYNSANAQPLGDRSSNLNWQELHIEQATYIYPKSIEQQTLKTAQFLNSLNQHNPIRYPAKERKYAVLLDHKTIESNGFVTLAPFRTEFFATPPQSLNSLGTTNWMQLLATHEERHIQQFNQANSGLSKLAYYVTGDFGLSIMQFLSIPNWFFEGDAVLTETALTKSGRGRVPHFTAFQRSIALKGKDYSYHQIRNGSYKNLIPNHYAWGYNLLAELTEEKGFDVLDDVVKDAASYRSIVYPFSRSLKKHTTYTSKDLYQKSWNSSKNYWKENIAQKTFTPTHALTDSILKVISYYSFPQYVNDSSFIVRKRTNKTTDIIEIHHANKKIESIAHPASSVDNFFHYKDSFIVWTAYQNHPRRHSESYENIILYDMVKKKQKKITQQGRYFSPIVFPKTSSIYSLRYNLNLQTELVQLNWNNNKEEILYTFPPSTFVARLSIDEDGDVLAYIKREDNQAAIFSYQLSTQEEKQITPWSAHSIDAPKIKGDFIYYEAGYNQINNIYKSPLSSSLEVIQLTEVPIGAYQVDINPKQDKLLFKEIIFNGNQLSELSINQTKNQTFAIIEPINQKWQYSHLNLDISEQLLNNDAIIDFTEFQKKSHKGLLRGFRLHSWPITASPATQDINLYFNNYINDLSAVIGGGYNYNEKGQFYNAEISYGKWFPIFTLWGDYNYRTIERIGTISQFNHKLFRQKSIGTTIQIPLEWTIGNYLSEIKTSVGYKWIDLHNAIESYHQDFQLASSKLEFSIKRRKAIQQLASPLGIATDLYYGKSLDNKKIEKVQMEGNIFLPSIFKTHSLQLGIGLKKELEENIYQEVDNFSYSRGYDYPFSDRYLRYSIDYHFPLFYPDWGFGGITYFKRISANLFFDYAQNKINRTNESYDLSATGVEIYFDNTYLNVLPLNIGLRTTYKLKATPYDDLSYPLELGIVIKNSF